MRSPPEPIRKFRAFGSEGIYDEGTTRAGVYFELLQRRGISLTEGQLLDVGSGFGGFSIQAARSGASVTALDGDLYRLRMLRRRLANEAPSVQSRVVTLEGDATQLPFKDRSFDRAMTIGVVEWVPLVSHQTGEPRSLQVQTLGEIRRVLKPGGWYVLATKNRWYPPHVLHEPNSGWPLVDALPRPLADVVAKAVWRQSYRTYNHSIGGWKAMLSEAGFGSTRVLVPLYGMHWPIDLLQAGSGGASVTRAADEAPEWIPPEYLKRTNGARANLKQQATRVMWSAGLENYLGQGFVFVATV